MHSLRGHVRIRRLHGLLGWKQRPAKLRGLNSATAGIMTRRLLKPKLAARGASRLKSATVCRGLVADRRPRRKQVNADAASRAILSVTARETAGVYSRRRCTTGRTGRVWYVLALASGTENRPPHPLGQFLQRYAAQMRVASSIQPWRPDHDRRLAGHDSEYSAADATFPW